MTTRPPSLRHSMAVKAPVPCISGQAGEQRHAGAVPLELGPDVVDAALERVPPEPAAVQPGEQVVLAPHDALGHPGGAPGVEHVQVVGAASPRGPHPPVSAGAGPGPVVSAASS